MFWSKGPMAIFFLIFFRKPTHCNSYIHFFSYHDDKVKYSVISSMFLRAYRICSPSYIDKEIELIFSCFKSLGYPHWFVEKAHFKARKIFYSPPVGIPFDYHRKLALPYIKENKSTVRDLKQLGYDTIYKYPNTIGKWFVKNSPKVQTEAGVYVIPCKDCQQPYIGESGRNYLLRLSEYKRAVRNGDQNNTWCVHMSENNHIIDWENTKLICKIKEEKKRKIIESAVISSVKNVNLNDGFYQFDSLTSRYVIEAANLKKTIKQLNEVVCDQEAVT